MNRRELAVLLMLPLLSAEAAGGVEDHYSVQLLAGSKIGQIWLAGIEVKLAPGWKTYWRMPGDAGIPPEFNWSGSENLASVNVMWPTPGRYRDAAGETVGYLERVVFPLHVTPHDHEAPVRLKLSMFFAVCKDICIPAKAKVETILGAASTDPSVIDDINHFMKMVPTKDSEIFKHARVNIDEGKSELVLQFAPGVEAQDLDVFVEGGGSAYFRALQPGSHRGEILLTIDGLKDPAKLIGRTLKLTVVKGGRGVEQEIAVE